MPKGNPDGPKGKKKTKARKEANKEDDRRTQRKKKTRESKAKGTLSSHDGEWNGLKKQVETRFGVRYSVFVFTHFSMSILGQKLNRWTEDEMRAACELYKSQQKAAWKKKHPNRAPISMKEAAKVRETEHRIG